MRQKCHEQFAIIIHGNRWKLEVFQDDEYRCNLSQLTHFSNDL